MIYERIEKALNESIKLHNAGMGVNDSIVKVAREHELNPETICRVVEAFNIAKTKAYVKVASDKTSDFEIGDKKEILSRVFKDSPQTHNKTASEVDVLFNGSNQFRYEEFSANVKPEEEIKVAQLAELPLNERIKTAFLAIEDQQSDISSKRFEIVATKERFYNACKTAVDLLTYPDEREQMPRYAAQIFYNHSDDKRAGRILGLIAKCASFSFEDMTEELLGAQEYTSSKFIEAFDEMVESDRDYSKQAKEFNEALREFDSSHQELKSLMLRAGQVPEEKKASDLLGKKGKSKTASSKFEPFPEDLLNDVLAPLWEDDKKAEDPAKGSDSKKKDSDALKFLSPLASGGVSAAKDFATKYDPTATPDIQKHWSKGYELRRKNEDPRLKLQTKNEIDLIKRKTMFAELMHDEIIGQQDPREVLAAYNTMISLAPTASMNKDIVRSVLRQGTAQVIDPFFANTLVELENNMLKTQKILTGELSPQMKA